MNNSDFFPISRCIEFELLVPVLEKAYKFKYTTLDTATEYFGNNFIIPEYEILRYSVKEIDFPQNEDYFEEYLTSTLPEFLKLYLTQELQLNLNDLPYVKVGNKIFTK